MKRWIAVLMAFTMCLAFPGMGVFADSAAASSGTAVSPWDGKTIDVSWYKAGQREYHISTAAQLAGLAAIVNGCYSSTITKVIGDASVIVCHEEGNDGEGSNNKASSTYRFGNDDFNGRTVYLDADIDMGGVRDEKTGLWSGPNYMPVGGQYLMEKNDSSTKIGASFNGTFDGQGHTVANIYCDRHCSNGNYGDGSSVGLIGRLGCHDSDPDALRPDNPAIRNVTVTGYIHANRSVGGICGKIGKTVNGGIIENCANFAAVSNTDAKGCGGICGAAWNAGVIRNCYNAGTVSSSYSCPTGGIAGSNEIEVVNCYSIGDVSAVNPSYAMAIGTNNGGGVNIDNCYWLTGSASDGYYGRTEGTVKEMSASQMQAASFVSALGDAFTADKNGINGGYPVLKVQGDRKAAGVLRPEHYCSVFSLADISTSAWYYENVKYVCENGLFDPAGAAAFGPDQPMTRQMLVTALYRLAGSPAVDSSQAAAAGVFQDVSASASYRDAVAWAYGSGVVNGVSADRFAPDSSITREQIAAMFMRYADVRGMDTSRRAELTGYRDAGNISAYAADGVSWCVGAGLINGTSADTISPKGTATRAQVAAMVQRYAS